MSLCSSALESKYLLSIGVTQDITSHYVDQVWFWIDFTHEATESPPESEQTQRLQLHGIMFLIQNESVNVPLGKKKSNRYNVAQSQWNIADLIRWGEHSKKEY